MALEKQLGDPGTESESPNPNHILIWNDDPPIMAMVLRLLRDYSSLNDEDHKILRELVPTTEKYIDQVSLPTLAKIATVVNKYDFHFNDAVQRSMML